MFGISPIGLLHTLGSLPAIPLAAYMIARYGRIVPRSIPGLFYLFFMLVGALTVFLVAKQAVSKLIGFITLALLLSGYGIGVVGSKIRLTRYIETIMLTLTVFFLMVPTVSEILRRVPDGHPFAMDLRSPLLLGAQALIFLALIIGLVIQVYFLRKGRLVHADPLSHPENRNHRHA